MSRASEQRFRTVGAVVAGVLAIVAVTVGIAHAYYGGDRATLSSQGMLSAPVDWVPTPNLGGSVHAYTPPKTTTKAAKTVFIPALPNLHGVNPKRLGFQWPVHGYHGITSPFGPRNGSFHHGADIGCAIGQTLYASRTGRVVFAGDAGDAYGNAVAIDHGNSYESVYGHMTTIYVHPGDVVRTGRPIGTCGMTGNATGPHVHFELRWGGYVWDPLLFLP